MASFAFRVEGIEPSGDPAWRLADESVRRAFWRAVVGFVLEAKDRELASGLDRFGVPLTPIAASTRARGRMRSHTGLGSAGNPPLTPANALSRTRALLTGRAMDDHAEFFWTTDAVTGLPWGQVLSWHRAGAGRLPVRDVIGLAPKSLADVKARAAKWWANYKAGHPVFDHEGHIKLQVGPGRMGKIPLSGRVDLEHATIGTGATKGTVAAAIKGGTFTGFRQLGDRPRVAVLKPERSRPDRPQLTRVKAGADAASKAKAAAEAQAAAEAKAAAKARADAIAKAAAAAKVKVAAEAKAAAAKAAAAAKVKAEATAGATTPGRLDRSAVASTLAALGPDAKPSEKNAAILALIEARQSEGTTTGAFHGMTDPETFHSITFEGVRYHFHPISGAGAIDNPIVSLIRSIESVPDLPRGLTKHTKDVYLSRQDNKEDPHWKIQYNNPNHVSAATGGDGTIVTYGNRQTNVAVLAHEMGHNLALGTYGGSTPPGHSTYGAALDSGEAPVSDYAKNSAAEDFAETVEVYVVDRERLRKSYPIRYAALEEILGP